MCLYMCYYTGTNSKLPFLLVTKESLETNANLKNLNSGQ